MIKNELFFHKQTPYGRSLGFSMLMKQDKRDPLTAWISVTMCRKSDKFFNKKIAREILRARPLEQVRVRDIPRIAAELEVRAESGPTEHFSPVVMDTLVDEYSFLVRKFL